ncbi:hypothetical protein FKM82_000534 [Ascaphus truei]
MCIAVSDCLSVSKSLTSEEEDTNISFAVHLTLHRQQPFRRRAKSSLGFQLLMKSYVCGCKANLLMRNHDGSSWMSWYTVVT